MIIFVKIKRFSHLNIISDKIIMTDLSNNININEKKVILEPNQSIFIPKKTKHRLANNHQSNLIIIEVWHGNILKEDDIVRYEDIYERDLI